MALNANQLSVKASRDAADTIASAIHDFAESMPIHNARDASTRRMLRRHAREIVELHDELNATEIFAPRSPSTENGHVEPDHEMIRALGVHQEG